MFGSGWPDSSSPSPPPFTADVWVAKATDGGSDSNDGLTINTPKLTINAGISILPSGKKLAIRRGTYNENITQSGIPAGGGTWATATQIVAYPSDPPGSVTILNGWAFYDPAENWIAVKGLIISGGALVGAPGSTPGAHHIRLTSCDVSGGNPNALLIEEGSDSNEFYSTRFHHSDGHAVYVGSSSNLWDHCEIDHSGQNPPVSTSGFGFHFYNGGSYTVSNNTVRYGKIHDCWLTGLMFSNGTNNLAFNNLVYGNGISSDGGHGLRISLNADNSLLYANTVYNNGLGAGGGFGVFVETADCSNSIIRNNISYLNASGDYVDSGTATVHDHNLESTNPSFVDAANANFHLQSGSAARNGGTDLRPTVPDDYDGVTRPATPDIGAYQFV